MRHSSHALTLLFAMSAFAPNFLQAQQLAQPASILPWQDAQTKSESGLEYQEATTDEQTTPSWLIETAKPLPHQALGQENLPMVETEQYANLGPINADPGTSRRLAAQRKRFNPNTKSPRPFNLFRSLGFQAAKHGR